jgi:hypothetical protein
VTTTTKTINSWGAVTLEDQSLVYRVVGTLEYMSALRNLDAFLSAASAEELAVADRIVTSRPEFTVFTRLSDRFRSGSQQWAFGGQGAAEKRGLMWVVALARLEAGAIVATFTRLPSPFEIVGPSRWEMPAYKELLMDGAMTHVWALANDGQAAVVARKPPDSEVLAYIRRINLTRAMLNAAARSNAPELPPQAWSQLVEQDRQLVAARKLFSAAIAEYVAKQNYSMISTQISVGQQKAFAMYCKAQLAGEQRELAAGTARVHTFKAK